MENTMRELNFKEVEDGSAGNPAVLGGILGGGAYLTGVTFGRLSAAANGRPLPEYSWSGFGSSIASGSGLNKLTEIVTNRWNNR